VYTAQLFFNQQQLQPNTVAALRKAVPALTDDDVDDMQRVPHRSFNPEILQVSAGRKQASKHCKHCKHCRMSHTRLLVRRPCRTPGLDMAAGVARGDQAITMTCQSGLLPGGPEAPVSCPAHCTQREGTHSKPAEISANLCWPEFLPFELRHPSAGPRLPPSGGTCTHCLCSHAGAVPVPRARGDLPCW
jgi:hypothetical protein